MAMTDEDFNKILWWEALRDSIEDGEYEDAIKVIDAAIKMLRREKQDAA